MTRARPYTAIDDKILALYFRGIPDADIVAFVSHAYAGHVTPDIINRVLNADLDEVSAWQGRRLAPMYPIVCFDALPVQIRVAGTICHRSIHWAMATLPDGRREMIGLWTEPAGASFWLDALNDLKARGCHDILMTASDHFEGIHDALAAVFPAATAETRVIHLIRCSLKGVRADEQATLARALRRIYGAASAESASAALDAFEQSVQGATLPDISAAWRDAWAQLTGFFELPPEVRQVIYSSDALERVHADLRRIVNSRARGYFPNHDAAMKVIWLAALHTVSKWARSDVRWMDARHQFEQLYGARFTSPARRR
jgi:transposase-like protein